MARAKLKIGDWVRLKCEITISEPACWLTTGANGTYHTNDERYSCFSMGFVVALGTIAEVRKVTDTDINLRIQVVPGISLWARGISADMVVKERYKR